MAYLTTIPYSVNHGGTYTISEEIIFILWNLIFQENNDRTKYLSVLWYNKRMAYQYIFRSILFSTVLTKENIK